MKHMQRHASCVIKPHLTDLERFVHGKSYPFSFNRIIWSLNSSTMFLPFVQLYATILIKSIIWEMPENFSPSEPLLKWRYPLGSDVCVPSHILLTNFDWHEMKNFVLRRVNSAALNLSPPEHPGQETNDDKASQNNPAAFIFYVPFSLTIFLLKWDPLEKFHLVMHELPPIERNWRRVTLGG